MNDIYQEHILDHANNPRNYQAKVSPGGDSEGVNSEVSPGGDSEGVSGLPLEGVNNKYICGVGDNPSCGDEGVMCIFTSPLWGEAGRGACVNDVYWSGRGCAISQASMSMMSEYIKGKSIKELKLMMPGDVYQMLGIQITLSRVNCALLPYRALENILSKIML